MDVDAAGQQVLAGAVDDIVVIGVEALPDQLDDLALDQDIGLYHVAGGDDASVSE